MRTKLASISFVGIALLGACGGSGSGSPDSANGTGGGADAPAFGPHEFGLDDEDLNARISEAEASIAACMTQAGFEYVPVDAVTVREAMDADGSLPGVSDEDFVAQHGFGITTVFSDPVAGLGRGEQNTRIYEALAAPEKVAYDRALLGEGSGVSLARALENEDFSDTGGCTLDAVDTLFAPEELSGSYVNPGDVLLEEDPRLVDAIGAWAECMAGDGYDYEHPDDVTDELAERFAAIVGDGDPTALAGAEAAALADLQDDERAIAPPATACEEEHIVPVESEIEAEIYGAPQS